MRTDVTIDRLIISLDDAADEHVDQLGLKGWYLSRLRDVRFATPAGFVVTTAVYSAAIDGAHVDHRLRTIWGAARNARPDQVAVLARKARHLIAQVRFDAALVREIAGALDALGAGAGSESDTGRGDVRGGELDDGAPAVAVRSSVAPGAVSGPECAGVHASFTNVSDLQHVVSRIHGCWASLFGERALAMRARGLGADDPAMAVVVQRMIAADKSGLVIPLGPSTDILIEATFGLGEPIISGAVEPDRYVIDPLAADPPSVTIGDKRVVMHSSGHAGHSFMPLDRQLARVLDDDEIAQVAHLSASVDQHFGSPHEIEWAIQNGVLHVLQIRPFAAHEGHTPSIDRTISGTGIGVGFATGPVRIVARPDMPGELSGGEILVVSETGPEWTPHLELAAAVITDEGDEGCHAARVARELGIPAVVGTGTATTVLDDGAYVTVDATRGWVLPAVSHDVDPSPPV